jgi:Mu transposase, C-terminal
VAGETAFLVDFLPVIRRTLTRTGFLIDHVQYDSDALKPWIARRGRMEKFVLCRDPRDISRIWALDPGGLSYLHVPYRMLSRPPISVWERRAAITTLREPGRDQVDESALFAMVEQMRRSPTPRPPRPAAPAGRPNADQRSLLGRPPRRTLRTVAPAGRLAALFRYRGDPPMPRSETGARNCEAVHRSW